MLVATVVAGVIAAGCGGASGEETYSVEADTSVTTAASVEKPQFVAHVKKICQRAWPIIVENFSIYSSTQNHSDAEKKRFTEAVQLSLLAGIDFHIFDLIYRSRAPEGEKEAVEEVIGSMQSAVERGQKRLAPISSVAQVTDLFAEYNQLAREYGLDRECLVDQRHVGKIELQ